jgi:tetratricopeptide (TPR) repeat protein
MSAQGALNPQAESLFQKIYDMLINDYRPDEAVRIAEEACERHPDDLDLKLVLLRTYVLAAPPDHFQEAVSLVEFLSQQIPENQEVWSTAALLYYDLCLYDRGLKAALKWVELESQNPDAWEKLGFFYEETGRLAEAIKAYGRAIEVGCEERKKSEVGRRWIRTLREKICELQKCLKEGEGEKSSA